MSIGMIKDGHGTGNIAQVDDHGRLYVNANMVSHEQHHSSYHQNLFDASFETVLAGATETPILFYKNTHTSKDYEFYGAVVSADADVEIRTYSGGVYTSGGAIPSTSNMNVGSGKVATNAIYEGGASADLVVSATNANRKGVYYIGASRPYGIDYCGGLILQTANTFHMTAHGATSDNVSVVLLFARHNSGYKL